MTTRIISFITKLSAALIVLTGLASVHAFADAFTANSSRSGSPVSHSALTTAFTTMAVASPDECNASTGFFGLVPWYHYLPAGDFGPTTSSGANADKSDANLDKCDINSNFHILANGQNSPSAVPLIILALIDNLLRIGAMAAVGFVIYGAIRFMTSQGNPDGASKAQSTIINALIGLGIAIVAVSFVTYLGNKLGG